MNSLNNLTELTARMIAGALGATNMPGPEVTFLRARVLGQRDSRTSGEINAAYSVGGIGRWPVWDTRPELTPFEAEWFKLRAKSFISESEIIFLANRYNITLTEVEKFSEKVNNNLLKFAKNSSYVPVVGLIPEQRGHFLFDNPNNLIGIFANWGIPSFVLYSEEASGRPWSGLIRFGVSIPDVLVPILKDATFTLSVGESLSDEDVVDIVENPSLLSRIVGEETSNLSDASGGVSDKWGDYEDVLLAKYSIAIDMASVSEFQLA